MHESTRTDTTESYDGLHPQEDETAEIAEDAENTPDDAEGELSKVGDGLSDAIEDVVPGDSDSDGH